MHSVARFWIPLLLLALVIVFAFISWRASRRAEKLRRESEARAKAWMDARCEYDRHKIHLEGGAGRTAADCAAHGDAEFPVKFGGFPKLPSKGA